MRWSLTALVALSALLVPVGSAGARPVAGGVYTAPLVTSPICCSIDLLVAPDRRSLDRSGSRAGAPCHGGDRDAGGSTAPPRGTRIDRRGRFTARRCVSTAGVARACRVAGYSCGPIDGGLLKALASAACVRGGARIELTIRHVCAELPARAPAVLSVWRVTTGCATAERVGRAWGRRRGCQRQACHVSGWVCRFNREVSRTRCARPVRPHQVLELALVIVLDGGD
jgi:hypothetical protein